ncbi:MAG: hypothetical protein J6S68_14330 [Acinetobacter sp.]|nr:hypothetical protein [Acinetobacter sp.]
MKSFDEFFKENFEDGLSDPSKYILKSTFEAGQQSKQAEVDELRKRIDDLTELNRLKTIALQQSVNRTSIHVHEKIVALEGKLKGDQS